MSKWVDFVEINVEGNKTKTFKVTTKDGYRIAEIKWYSPWRQYCFFPEGNALFNIDCMRDISEFITQLMEERKEIHNLQDAWK